MAGTRALEIAERLEDLRLRIPTMTYLAQAHFYRGEYDRVAQLAIDNLAALPADWLYEYFGSASPASVYDRSWLAMSLAELGRFAEAAEYQAEAIRLAEPPQHAHTVSVAYVAAVRISLYKGDWAKAGSAIDHWIGVLRRGDVVIYLPQACASSAWVLAHLGDASESLNPPDFQYCAPLDLPDALRDDVPRQAAGAMHAGHAPARSNGWCSPRCESRAATRRSASPPAG